MFVTRYNPRKDIQDFRRGFANLNTLLDDVIEKGSIISHADFVPTVNTREGENAYHVEVDLPGMKKRIST